MGCCAHFVFEIKVLQKYNRGKQYGEPHKPNDKGNCTDQGHKPVQDSFSLPQNSLDCSLVLSITLSHPTDKTCPSILNTKINTQD